MTSDPLAHLDFEEIERIDAPSPLAFERDYRRRGRPVVMRLATGDAPLTLDELRERFGDLAVSALATDRGVLRGTSREGVAFDVLRLGDVLDVVRTGRDPGWHVSTPVSELPEELVRAFGRMPAYGERASFSRSRLWLAAVGTVTPLHFDLPHNFIRPIFGRRRVLLYPPADGLLLRPNGALSKMANFASFDPERDDPRRLPLSRLARPVRTVLARGDVLYVPPGWWHHIRTTETSLAINTWWGGRALEAIWRAGHVWKRARAAYRGEWTRPGA